MVPEFICLLDQAGEKYCLSQIIKHTYQTKKRTHMSGSSISKIIKNIFLSLHISEMKQKGETNEILVIF